MKATPRPTPVLPLLAGSLIFLSAGVGTWWVWQGLGQVQAEAQALADRQGQPGLAQILARPEGVEMTRRETKELAKLREEMAREDSELTGSWSRGYQEALGVGQDWSQDPGRWKDRLIQLRSDLFRRSRESPAERRVLLKEDFFLGLEAFQQRSPAAADLPEVSRDLSAAYRLVSLLLEAKGSLSEGYPTPCRLITLTVPSGNPTKNQGEPPVVAKRPPSPPGPATAAVPRFRYEIEIESSPELLFDYVGRLSQDPWLWVPMDLRVNNELATFPSRSEIRKGFVRGGPAEEGGGNPDQAEAPKLLQVLAGKEKINSKLRLDLIGWPPAPTPPAAQPTPGS